MSFKMFSFVVAGVLTLAASTSSAQTSAAGEDAAAYQKVTQERAAKIVATIDIPNAERASRVRDIIARQYQELSKIHATRDARIDEIKKRSSADKDAVSRETQQTRDEVRLELDRLHAAYLARLANELAPEQVDKVKDGMTYGVMPGTYNVYLKMYPNLSEAQKQQVKSWLAEARELAMDEGSSKEKHAVFGKYKGRINNYLVKEGYDLKQGEANLRESMKKPDETQSK